MDQQLCCLHVGLHFDWHFLIINQTLSSVLLCRERSAAAQSVFELLILNLTTDLNFQLCHKFTLIHSNDYPGSDLFLYLIIFLPFFNSDLQVFKSSFHLTVGEFRNRKIHAWIRIYWDSCRTKDSSVFPFWAATQTWSHGFDMIIKLVLYE